VLNDLGVSRTLFAVMPVPQALLRFFWAQKRAGVNSRVNNGDSPKVGPWMRYFRVAGTQKRAWPTPVITRGPQQIEDDEAQRHWRWHREPDCGIAWMTAGDVAHVLEYLTFVDGFGLIRLDHGCRDFLLRQCGGTEFGAPNRACHDSDCGRKKSRYLLAILRIWID
jgi:hypothetical protein